MFWTCEALLKVVVFQILVRSGFGYAKLNTPHVLLPPNLSVPSSLTLQILDVKDEDCFEWFSSAATTVHVQPLQKQCSRSAIVTAVTSSAKRQVTRITAVQIGKPDVRISSDVLTEAIHSIELSYAADELLMEGPPELISVAARSVRGQRFSSINGINVVWTVTGNSISKGEAESGDRSAVVVRPLAVGSAMLGCALQLPTVLKKEVSLVVSPNIFFHPSDQIFLLLKHSVRPRLQTFEQGKLVEVEIEDFEIEVGDPSVAQLQSDKSITAMKYGSTLVSYEDKRNPSRKVILKIFVVKLDSIDIRISEGNFWILEESKRYEVSIEPLDSENNQIYVSNDMKAVMNFPHKLFHVNATHSNGVHQIVQSVTPGSGTLKIELFYMAENEKLKSKTASQKVAVCQKIQLTPPALLLPLYETDSALYQIPFKATGGTGSYSWFSNAEVIQSNPKNNNTAILHVHEQGEFVVTATDTRNPNLIATAKVSIQPVADIESYPSVVETNVGNVIIIPTALLGYECQEKKVFKRFDDCSTVELSVEVIDEYVLAQEKDSDVAAFGSGCVSLQFRCLRAGHSRVNVLYKTLKTTFILSCFKELKPVHPVRVVVLALQTSSDVTFEGGPRKWPMKKDGHFAVLKADNPKVVDIELIRDPVRYNRDLSVFKVTCKELGENTLSFEIGNHPSPTNKFPAKVESSVKVVCSEPHSVQLKLSSKKQNTEDNVVKVPFYGERLFSVEVQAKDEAGRRLRNISSLDTEWRTSDTTLAQPRQSRGFTTHVDASAGYRRHTKDFQEFELKGGTGELNVSIQITGYLSEDLKTQANFQTVSGSVSLKLVSLRDIHSASYSNIEDKEEPESSCKSGAMEEKAS